MDLDEVVAAVGMSPKMVRACVAAGVARASGVGGMQVFSEDAVARLLFAAKMRPIRLPLGDVAVIVNSLWGKSGAAGGEEHRGGVGASDWVQKLRARRADLTEQLRAVDDVLEAAERVG